MNWAQHTCGTGLWVIALQSQTSVFVFIQFHEGLRTLWKVFLIPTVSCILLIMYLVVYSLSQHQSEFFFLRQSQIYEFMNETLRTIESGAEAMSQGAFKCS